MSPEIIGLIGILVMMAFLGTGMWIGIAMAISSFIGIILIRNLGVALTMLGGVTYQNVAFYAMSVVPMFVFMGQIVAETEIGDDMYFSARQWMGQIRGGLASATVVACAMIAAITGGTTTGILVMSKVALPQMKKYGYDEAMAAGSISSASTMGILIPPSIAFVMYGIICEQSIGKLFMAGVIPGVLQALFYIAAIYVWCRINPKLGPAGPKTQLKEKIASLKYTWPILSLFVLVIGGIYGGIFTPTEAGAVGAFGSIVIAACLKRLTKDRFIAALSATAIITGMIMLMMVGTFLFMQFMTLSKLPQALGTFIAALAVPGWLVLTAIVVLYFVLGGPLPELPLIMLTVPIFYPVIVSLGISPIWFGVIIVRMLEVGSISPPVGQNIFVMNAVSGVPITQIYRGTWAFLIADALHIILLLAVPWLSLALPNMMK
jgi:C4-dicarboxylate transporter, DctM subunit